MPTSVPARRIAVLIDGDNISPNHAEELFAVVNQFGHCRVRRIYGSTGGEKLKGWAGAIKRHAILVNPGGCGGSGKNATDIMLVIDAMDLVHSGRVDGFCLASADRDFTALALRIREHGLPVFGFCQDSKAAGCREAFDGFMVLGAAKVAKIPTVAAKPQKAPVPASAVKPPAAPSTDVTPHVPLIRTVIEELQAGSDNAGIALAKIAALLRQKHPAVAKAHLSGKASGKCLKLIQNASRIDKRIEVTKAAPHQVRLKMA